MQPTPLRVVFAGTPGFAAQSLQALVDSQHQVIAVYTQPDRPAGRGRKLTASPVKALAQKHAIPVYQPVSLKPEAEQQTLRMLEPDVMIVAAYGLLLPQAVLDIPRLGCLNIHASLLPHWRGAAPIQRAILNGDSSTGITIMQMDAGLDTGDMLFKRECEIKPTDTGGSLHDRLAMIGAESLLVTLENIQQEKLNPVVQDNTQASYAHKLDKNEARLDWCKPANQLALEVRAFNPWPVAFFVVDNKPVRIWQAQQVNQPANAVPGTILRADKQGIDIACGENILRLLALQPPGKKAMDCATFLNGRSDWVKPGSVLPGSET